MGTGIFRLLLPAQFIILRFSHMIPQKCQYQYQPQPSGSLISVQFIQDKFHHITKDQQLPHQSQPIQYSKCLIQVLSSTLSKTKVKDKGTRRELLIFLLRFHSARLRQFKLQQLQDISQSLNKWLLLGLIKTRKRWAQIHLWILAHPLSPRLTQLRCLLERVQITLHRNPLIDTYRSVRPCDLYIYPYKLCYMLTINAYHKPFCIRIQIDKIMECCKPPSYIRGVHFNNASGHAAKANVKFASGETKTFDLPAGVVTEVEKGINQGSYETVDPILDFSVEANGKTNAINDAAAKIQIRHYTIGADCNLTRTT